MKKLLFFVSLCLALTGCSSEDPVSDIQEPQKPEPQKPELQFADFKLPSGTLWSKTNLGADSELSPGYYYAWGEISPKNKYTWESYLWQTGSHDGAIGRLTKYVLKLNDGSGDRIINLLPEDDAASKFSDGLKIPTPDQFRELFAHTSQKEISIDGEHYYLIAPRGKNLQNVKPAKKEPLFSFEYLLLPMAGYMENGVVKKPKPSSGLISDFGYYWTSYLYIENNLLAEAIHLNRYNEGVGGAEDGISCGSEPRYRGLNIRPVKTKDGTLYD